MQSSPFLLTLIGLLLALWTVAAGWIMIRASTRVQAAEGTKRAVRRLSRMIEDSPAIPLLVRADGRIEAPDRLAGWLGLDAVPQYLSELAPSGAGGLSEDQLEQLTTRVRRTQKTAAPFQMTVKPRGSKRALALRGSLADPNVSPSGAALVWVFDLTESEEEVAALREETARARGDFGALVGLIEAAPMPMWFRSPQMQLRLVNTAYVAAVGAQSPDEVVARQIELIETVDGVSAAEVAQQAGERRKPIERIVSATIKGARRTCA